MQDEGSIFWEDLQVDLNDPEFVRAYVVAAARVETIDRVMNALDSARVSTGTSKAELARAIGQEPAALRRLFSVSRANPTLGTLAEIATALGLRITVEPLTGAERALLTESLGSGTVKDPDALRRWTEGSEQGIQRPNT